MRRKKEQNRPDKNYALNRSIANLTRDLTTLQERIVAAIALMSKCKLDENGFAKTVMGEIQEQRNRKGELIVTDLKFNMAFLLGEGFKDGKQYNATGNVLAAFRGLMTEQFGEFDLKTGKFMVIPLFTKISGNIYEGTLCARIDASVWSIFTGIHLPFNNASPRIIARLQSPTDIKIYERFCGLDRPITYTIDSFKKIMKCEDKYPNVHDFLKRNLIGPLKRIAEEGKIIPYTINRASDKKTSPIVSFTVYPEIESRKIRSNVKRHGLQKYFSTEEVLAMMKYFDYDEIVKNIGLFLSVKWFDQEDIVRLLDKYFKDSLKNKQEPKSWIISKLQKSAIIWD